MQATRHTGLASKLQEAVSHWTMKMMVVMKGMGTERGSGEERTRRRGGDEIEG